MMPPTELGILAGIGLVAGLIGGMLGLGGSIIMIPAMTELLGPDQHLYQAAAMIVNVFVGIPAVYQHRRANAVHRATVARLVPISVLAVIIGVGASEMAVFAGDGEVFLRGVFGLFLGGIAAQGLLRRIRGSRPLELRWGGGESMGGNIPAIPWTWAAVVAVPAGFVGGLLGVGGGVLAVPLQQRLLRIPVRNAIANSATVIVATSLVGAFFKNYAYITESGGSPRSLALAAVLIPTAVVGSLSGSRLTHRLPLRVVHLLLLLMLMLAGLRLTYQACGALPVLSSR